MAQNGPVDILGMCQSACTLVTAYIRKDRLCFGERGYLSFHMARLLSNDRPSLESTQWIIDQYPDDIRGWIIAKGGAAKMPIEGYWTLPASDLWQMGYRKCGS